ncbi:MAG: flagellar hook-basal body protein [Solibacillus sp.]
MLRTMFTATNTLSQTQQQIDNISKNLTNTSTIGYKTKQANFSELMYQQYNNDKFDKTVRDSPVGIRYGVGARIGQIQSNQAQGALQRTDRHLDFAMTEEDRYFNVELPNGETAYTRNGAFYLTPVEPGITMLVNGDGYPVMDANGERITFPDFPTGFIMLPNGTLDVNYENSTESFDVAVTSILKPQVMEHKPGGTYIQVPANLEELNYTEADLYTDLQGANREDIGIQAGVLEMSNVEIPKEMSDLISAQRSYQFNTRAISIADQMLGLINGIR